MQTIAIPDAASVIAKAGRGFLVTSGSGGVFHIDASRSNSVVVSRQSLRWDNHLSSIVV